MSPFAEIPQPLILRARSGDAAAFRQLVDLLAGLTFNIAWRMTGHRADAEDMSQEVFLRLHRHFATYDPSLPFLPWFRRLSSNACLNWCRDHRSKRPDQLVDADLPAPERPVPETALRDAVRTLPRSSAWFSPASISRDSRWRRSRNQWTPPSGRSRRGSIAPARI